MCIGGGDPNRVNHTSFRTMNFQLFDQTKRNKKGLRKSLKIDSLPPFGYLNEGDANVRHVEVMDEGYLRIDEDLNGSRRNEIIVINQRGSFRGHNNCLYSTSVNAGAGRDTIIINHRNASNENSVNDQVAQIQGYLAVDGGEGIDTYIEKNTGDTAVGLFVTDMEVGEKLITHRSNNSFDRYQDWGSDGSWWSVRIDGDGSGNGSRYHNLFLPENTRLERLFNAQGDAVFMCVPES